MGYERNDCILCPYCDEATEAYFRLINTILLAGNKNELRQGIENLKIKIPLDNYFVYGFNAHLLGAPTQVPRPDAAVHTQTIESKILTP